jgi:DNA-directed RNA polymerase specialized sigma24 family protein
MVTHDGVEYEEIASRLGMSVEAVRVSLSRARKKIRDNYKKLDR